MKHPKNHKSMIENEIYVNGEKKLISQNLSIELTYPTGEKCHLQAHNEFIDVKNIPYINGKYCASLKYKNYSINVNIPSEMFLSPNHKKNEPIIWKWNIVEKVIKDTLQVNCTFLLTLQESWIELEIPATVLSYVSNEE